MFQRWPKRDPNKHYYLVPNEVFNTDAAARTKRNHSAA